MCDEWPKLDAFLAPHILPPSRRLLRRGAALVRSIATVALFQHLGPDLTVCPRGEVHVASWRGKSPNRN